MTPLLIVYHHDSIFSYRFSVTTVTFSCVSVAVSFVQSLFPHHLRLTLHCYRFILFFSFVPLLYDF
jgi:hypothetical protein